MPRLYELTDAYAGLVAALEDCETEEQALAVIAAIDDVTSDISDKANNYAKILRNLKADADELAAKANIFKAEADRLFAKAKVKENYGKKLKEYLLYAMEVAGLRQIPTDIGKFYTQKTASVEVVDAWKVPEEFSAPQPPKVDKVAIASAFKQTGEIIPGVEIKITDGLRFR